MSDPNVTSETRTRMVRAAVDTICEIGYYRASSNEIARRAGVSWGAIQHHFGNRQNLMFAAFREACEEALQTFSSATITGDTVEERFVSLQRIVDDFYGRKSYTAILQIIWNLISDPDTAEELSAALAPVVEQLNVEHRRLVLEVSPRATDEFIEFSFRVGWGLAVNLASSAYRFRPATGVAAEVDHGRMLSRALAGLVESSDEVVLDDV